MTTHPPRTSTLTGDEPWNDAVRSAAAFLAGFGSPDTRKSYRRDLHCWLEFCAANQLHPHRGIRRTHVEVYLRQLEQRGPRGRNGGLAQRRRYLAAYAVQSQS